VTRELIEQSRQHPPAPLPGWGGVPEYTTWIDEQMSWKRSCYLGDWSFLPAVQLDGEDALALSARLFVNSFARFDIGQAKHVVCCNEDGKTIGDGILERLSEHSFVVTGSPAPYVAYMAHTSNLKLTARYVDWFFYQVQGPRAFDVLSTVFGDALKDIRFMRFASVNVDGHEILALRQGMSGELGGFELQGVRDDRARILHDSLLQAGREFGIRRLGTRSAMINHLEAWYPTCNQHYLPAMFGPDLEGFRAYLESDIALQQGIVTDRLIYLRRQGGLRNISGSFEGHDISDYYLSPVELGWKNRIKFDHDFIGRNALEAEVSRPRRVGVTLEFNGDDVLEIFASLLRPGEPFDFLDLPHSQKAAMHASSIVKDGRLVGISTRPAYSYYFRKVLSISFVDVAEAKPGTEVEVVWGGPGRPQTALRATVARAPYKDDERRAPLSSLSAQPS
jgi:vanillate/3-O-methylgallate O-demethylase